MSDIRATWLAMLAKVIAPTDRVRAFDAMEGFLPFLQDVPDAAFNTASLEAVAMTERRLWLPELREVKAPLLAWWRANQPARPALAPSRRDPEPDRPPPTDEERAAVAQRMEECLRALGQPRTQARTVGDQLAAIRGGAGEGTVVPMRRSRRVEATPEQIAAAREDLARRARGER